MIGEMIWVNDQWAVTTYGIEALSEVEYSIPKGELCKLRSGKESEGVADWPLHMADKTWVDKASFMEAFEKALDVHNPGGFETLNLEATREVLWPSPAPMITSAS